MSRTKIVAGNWKMNQSITEGLGLVTEIRDILTSEVHNNAKVIIIPPFLNITSSKSLLKDSKIELGAQNCYIHQNGAYTGEISTSMIKEAGCKYCIIGHSERRQYFNESNALLSQKVNACIEQDITPIYCCGETLDERNAEQHFNIIQSQIAEGLFHLSSEDIKKVIIAYEPVWAIGTGVTASKEQAQEMHAFIRNQIELKYGLEIAQSISILYGGSVKPDNAQSLFACNDIDGGLIGGAALNARQFIEIIKSF